MILELIEGFNMQRRRRRRRRRGQLGWLLFEAFGLWGVFEGQMNGTKRESTKLEDIRDSRYWFSYHMRWFAFLFLFANWCAFKFSGLCFFFHCKHVFLFYLICLFLWVSLNNQNEFSKLFNVVKSLGIALRKLKTNAH
jgi:hypothetical protein